MQSFNWVDIDGIRYSWDGQGAIVCTGQFGYQATMAGDRISALELESNDGDLVGRLDVDFAAATITFAPVADAEPLHMVVLVGDEQGQQQYALPTLSDPGWQDLLIHSTSIDCTPLLTVSSLVESAAPHQGRILSWDAFHFDDDILPAGGGGTAPGAGQYGHLGDEISINIDLTNQILDQLPPLYEI